MKVNEFALKYRLNARDAQVVIGLYKDEEKTEKEWINLLTSKVEFISPSKVSEKKVQEKIVKAKEKAESKKSEDKSKENNKK